MEISKNDIKKGDQLIFSKASFNIFALFFYSRKDPAII